MVKKCGGCIYFRQVKVLMEDGGESVLWGICDKSGDNEILNREELSCGNFSKRVD